MIKSKPKLSLKILIILILSVVFNLLFITSDTKAVVRDTNITTISDKDTYIFSHTPNETAIIHAYLPTGFSSINIGHSYEAYFHFNFTDKPSNNFAYEAEISLYFWSGNEWQAINYTVCLIENYWQEDTITWDNAPIKGEKITNIIASSNGIYKFNVTPYIEGRSSISICVYIEIENYIQDMSYIWSKDMNFSPEDSYKYPQLIWSFMENATIDVNNPISSDNWYPDNDYFIRWNSVGNIDSVIIELFKGSLVILDLSWEVEYRNNTNNDGEFNFYLSYYHVQVYNLNGSNYRIKISDYDDDSLFGFSNFFSIHFEYQWENERTPQSISFASNKMILISILISIALTTYLIRKKLIKN
ncbi:MAG: CBM96 family carbohydrate-binding protein [Candidatus Hodarchaeales archaeon]|jgi:hypothetical protein